MSGDQATSLEFLRWAAKLLEGEALEERERTYKLETAAKLAAAREQVLAGAPGWPESVRRGLQSGNLLNQFLLMSVIAWLRSDAEGARAALLTLWQPEHPSAALVSDFSAALPGLDGRATPGNRVALASVLLMARDPGRFPPYRVQALRSAMKLWGFPLPTADLTDSGLYQHALDFFDALARGAQAEGMPVRDRLDAQGLAWLVGKYAPPRDWPTEEQAAFHRWRGEEAPESVTGHRAWLVRGSAVNGQNLVPRWVTEGWTSLWLRHLEPLEPGATLAEVRAGVDAGYSGRGAAYRRSKAEDAHAFLTRLAVDDLVVTTSEGRLYVGRVIGVPEWAEEETLPARLRRPVEWLNAADPVPYESLPAPLPDRLASQDDVTDLTDDLAVIESLVRPGEVVVMPPIAVRPELVLREPTPELAEELLVPQAWLERLVRLLGDRRQVILYGPPGTGKTFLALKVARYLASDPGDVRLVQFHPSYSYEDFFEGYRPVKGADGQVGFELKAGPFRRIVEAARDNPTTPYVLVIDEINRANLAKVFGELYFLLEYRDQSVDLLYGEEGTEAFRLPPNVFVVGTMNTADRSIALVDAAMRRRFAFVSLHPDDEPVRSLLRRWLDRHGRDQEPALLLEALNREISDSDFRIGPSYLMRESVYDRDDGIAEVWESDLLPLLTEHHVGDSVDVRTKYGLAALRRAITASMPDVEEAAPEPQ